eukprot:scaffold37678_cov65-Phaeocystis_antarctica.AAC.4
MQRLGERHQPECRFLAGLLPAPLRPARHDCVLGAGRVLLITPRVAQKRSHLPHRGRHRALVERRPCCCRRGVRCRRGLRRCRRGHRCQRGQRGPQRQGSELRGPQRQGSPEPRGPHEVCRAEVRVVGEVRSEQLVGGQAPQELGGAFERGVGIAAADERRDRRRLFRLSAAPAQAPQAVVEAATIVGRGEGGTQEEGCARGHICPVVEVVDSLDPACDVEPSEKHAEAQERETEHGPQPPQGGAWLHGAIAAAALRGDERAGDGEEQCGTQEAKEA